jgi:hypothetical protein
VGGTVSEPSGNDEPREVAFAIGWEHGLHGRPMADYRSESVDEQRAYIDGYRLGEADRTGVRSRALPSDVRTDLSRVRLVLGVGVAVALLVIGAMLGISAR